MLELVLPAKIFEIKDTTDPGSITGKLQNFSEEELYQTQNGETFKLLAQIVDLETEGNSVSGVFSKDFIEKVFYRRKLAEAPVTEEIQFWISSHGGRLFLLVSGPSSSGGRRKLLTNYVANKISQILFMTRQGIVEVKITHETLQELHERNPEATKLIWFDQVDIPGVEKLCLAGSDIAETRLYRDYLDHGQIWYVVFEVEKRGFVVGMTRNAVVTLFSKSTLEEFIDYVTEDILPLVK